MLLARSILSFLVTQLTLAHDGMAEYLVNNLLKERETYLLCLLRTPLNYFFSERLCLWREGGFVRSNKPYPLDPLLGHLSPTRYTVSQKKAHL